MMNRKELLNDKDMIKLLHYTYRDVEADDATA